MLLQKETPLANAAFWAARRGNLTLLRLLLNSGRVDVDCRDSVRTSPFSTRMLGAGCPPLASERLLNTLPFTALVPFFMRCPLYHVFACLMLFKKSKAPLLLFSRSVMSNSLRPHGLQHAGPPCPSLSLLECAQTYAEYHGKHIEETIICIRQEGSQ